MCNAYFVHDVHVCKMYEKSMRDYPLDVELRNFIKTLVMSFSILTPKQDTTNQQSDTFVKIQFSLLFQMVHASNCA